MRTCEFTENSHDGFLLDRTRDDRIEGRYIEKMSYQETLSDPFGGVVSFDRITYRQAQFTIYRDFPQLELRDAPRSTQALMSRLLELTGFTMVLEPVRVDIMCWAEVLRTVIDAEIIMESVQLSDVVVAPEITGTMVLKSERDIRKSLGRVVDGRTYTVDRARLSWNEPAGGLVTVDLGKDASARVDTTDAGLLTALRASLV